MANEPFSHDQGNALFMCVTQWAIIQRIQQFVEYLMLRYVYINLGRRGRDVMGRGGRCKGKVASTTEFMSPRLYIRTSLIIHWVSGEEVEMASCTS